MNKRNAFLLISLVIIGFSAFIYYNMGFSGEIKQEQEDRLAKPRIEGVEENINAYNLEDDLKITLLSQRDEEAGIMGLSQEEKRELLEHISPASMNTVLEEYNTHLPEEINNALQYHHYNISFDYLLVTAEEGAEIRENPDPNSTVLASLDNLDKVSLLQRVEGEYINGSNIWYRIVFSDEVGNNEGYVSSTTGTPRIFRFENMKNKIYELRQLLSQGELHFVSNYKNQNGAAPQSSEAAVDEFGYRVYHSAPAYQQPDTESKYRYVPDGMLVRILDEINDFYYINIPSFSGNFYIPKRYINSELRLSQLNSVIVVDRDQQNQAAFEIADNTLNLISYTLSTTGISGDFSFVTSSGIYKAIEKRERFEYLKSGSQEIAGYAPYATRFSGGAYIHGVPVKYEEQDGEIIDPGIREYLHTIGTFPRSSMCVRNFSSHAEFIYNWMNIQNGAVIVI